MSQQLIDKLTDLGLTPEICFNEFDDFPYLEKDKEQLNVIYTLMCKYTYGTEEYKMVRKDYEEFRTEAENRILDQIGGLKVVHQQGGDEGEGEYVELVIHIPAHDVYLKATASYYSYRGIDYWSDWKVATPKKVEITVYD